MISNTWHCSVCMTVFRTRYPTMMAIKWSTNYMSPYCIHTSTTDRNTTQNILVTRWHHVKTLWQTQIMYVLEVHPLFPNQSPLSLSSSLLHGLSVSCSMPGGGERRCSVWAPFVAHAPLAHLPIQNTDRTHGKRLAWPVLCVNLYRQQLKL
jgi:hypothetical protein